MERRLRRSTPDQIIFHKIPYNPNMKEFYRAKFNEPFMEFTRYLITHPDFGEDIPKGSEVILLDRLDPDYTRYMLEKAPKQDVVLIDVGKLAPIRSRLQKPKIIPQTSRCDFWITLKYIDSF